MSKIIFGVIWIVSLVLFFVGQLVAPPNYADSIQTSWWGNFFGIVVLVGIISFIGMCVMFIRGLFTDKKKQVKTKKYDYSIKHLSVRFLLAILLTIIFAVAMLPFMTDATGLLYQQRASIGDQNMTRVVMLWWLFTILTGVITFAKKRFRLSAVILIIFGILGSGLYLTIKAYDRNAYQCNRANPYILPNEFTRSLDLISQRLGIDEYAQGTLYQTAFNFRNCINVRYAETANEIVGAEGMFLLTDPTLQNLEIIVDPRYKEYDDITISTLLIHEVTHAGQYINDIINGTEKECYDAEAEAFTAQAYFLNQLNKEEYRSVNTRVIDDITANPQFETLVQISEIQSQVYDSCINLKANGIMTDDQFNSCYWDGTKNKIREFIVSEGIYEDQCGY